jgi:hypothetical protein
MSATMLCCSLKKKTYMKNLIDYYESILDEPDFNQVAKDVEKFKEQQIDGMFANILTKVSYNKNKNVLKIDKNPLYIAFFDNALQMPSANKIKVGNDYFYRPFEELKKYDVKLDANINIGMCAIGNGFKLSDLNFIGKNRTIYITTGWSKNIYRGQLKYRLVKSFFDTSFDPSNILKFDFFETWAEYLLEDSFVSNFAAVRTDLSRYQNICLNDLYDCQAKVLMIDDCGEWAKLKPGVKSYKEYFDNMFQAARKPSAVLTSNSTDPFDVIHFFLISNPKTKLLVRLRDTGSYEHIYLKDNKIAVDTIKGPSPWKKI